MSRNLFPCRKSFSAPEFYIHTEIHFRAEIHFRTEFHFRIRYTRFQVFCARFFGFRQSLRARRLKIYKFKPFAPHCGNLEISFFPPAFLNFYLHRPGNKIPQKTLPKFSEMPYKIWRKFRRAFGCGAQIPEKSVFHTPGFRPIERAGCAPSLLILLLKKSVWR